MAGIHTFKQTHTQWMASLHRIKKERANIIMCFKTMVTYIKQKINCKILYTHEKMWEISKKTKLTQTNGAHHTEEKRTQCMKQKRSWTKNKWKQKLRKKKENP